ncbi:MAG: glycerophosphodiester phosphodiesterase [Sinobacteraceae bacterium]|nr:glycerophosphodiester phosphodiesterase [Nevskiaceae bacterium]
MLLKTAVSCALLQSAATGSVRAARPTQTEPPLVIAHRGCSALRPEHTLEAYAKAIEDGADFIEPDLVVTRDGQLVARHENNLADSTDVAIKPQFASRRCVKIIDGERREGWFAEDFTLEELRSLRTRERFVDMRQESRRYDGLFGICTLEEIVDLVEAKAKSHQRIIGLAPEFKHSSYFQGLGLALEPLLLAQIETSAYLRRCPLILQSFEIKNLQQLRERLSTLPNVQLMQLIGDPRRRPWDAEARGADTSYGDMLSPRGLAAVAEYADYVAPPARVLIPLDAEQRLGEPSGIVETAHTAGLLVGTWTFRPENRFLPADFRDGGAPEARNELGSVAEMQRYLALGIDALFTDDPGLGNIARAGRHDMRLRHGPAGAMIEPFRRWPIPPR